MPFHFTHLTRINKYTSHTVFVKLFAFGCHFSMKATFCLCSVHCTMKKKEVAVCTKYHNYIRSCLCSRSLIDVEQNFWICFSDFWIYSQFYFSFPLILWLVTEIFRANEQFQQLICTQFNWKLYFHFVFYLFNFSWFQFVAHAITKTNDHCWDVVVFQHWLIHSSRQTLFLTIFRNKHFSFFSSIRTYLSE